MALVAVVDPDFWVEEFLVAADAFRDLVADQAAVAVQVIAAAAVGVQPAATMAVADRNIRLSLLVFGFLIESNSRSLTK